MMKLLLAVIATCALVVSPTCIKIKHQLRSNAPTIHVLISNGNTQMTSQVGRNGSHRFITDNLSSMTLAPAGTQTITLSYDEIFPITNAAVCTEVHPLSAGGCADGVCCKISISMYTITDAIIMTARVNNRNADGNPQFWKCEQEIQVPGVTNTEPTGEELAAEILQGEAGDPCTTYHDCKDAAQVYVIGYRCESDDYGSLICKNDCQRFGTECDDANSYCDSYTSKCAAKLYGGETCTGNPAPCMSGSCTICETNYKGVEICTCTCNSNSQCTSGNCDASTNTCN